MRMHSSGCSVLMRGGGGRVPYPRSCANSIQSLASLLNLALASPIFRFSALRSRSTSAVRSRLALSHTASSSAAKRAHRDTGAQQQHACTIKHHKGMLRQLKRESENAHFEYVWRR